MHFPQIQGQDLQLQKHIATHTRGRGSRIRPKLLLRPLIPPTLLQSIALPPPGEDHTGEPSPISGIMTPDALPLPPNPSLVSFPAGSQSPIPEMQSSLNNGLVSTPEIRLPSAMSHPPPLDDHEYPPISALNPDWTYQSSPAEQAWWLPIRSRRYLLTQQDCGPTRQGPSPRSRARIYRSTLTALFTCP